MSALLLKIAKVMPRLDSTFDNEVLSAVRIMAKLLATNVDDNGSPQPLKFVDAGQMLAGFVTNVLQVEAEPEPEPVKQPQPAKPSGFTNVNQPQPQPAQAAQPTPPPPNPGGGAGFGGGGVGGRGGAGGGSSFRSAGGSGGNNYGSRTAWSTSFGVNGPPAHVIAAKAEELIKQRKWRNAKEKDFLEKIYFIASSNFSMSIPQRNYFYSIADRT